MKVENIKALLDACYQAKRVRELLPALPSGVTPSYIHYLDVIDGFEKKGLRVKVSDISEVLNIPRPGVTRTVKEMVESGYIEKTACEQDGRITYLTVTKEGRRLSHTYNERFFSELVPLLADISDEDAEATVKTVKKLYRVMSERRIGLE